MFVGLTTRSFKKMMVTYVVGMLGIAGVLLPDWAYFDRDFSRWGSAVTGEERASHIAQSSGLKRSFSSLHSFRNRISPTFSF